MTDKTIKIMGAGPAGLVAAINLAKAGYKVTIFEKENMCGKRFDGDFQGLENWSQKTDILDDLNLMNIKINFQCTPLQRLKFYDYKFNSSVIDSGKSLLYLVRRGTEKGSLDQGLLKQAQDAGVKIKFNTLAKKEECHIISDGPSDADAITKGITFITKMEDTVIMILDDNIAPKGYAYLIINEGHGCLVTVLFRHFHDERKYFKKMKEYVSKIIDLNISDVKEFEGFGNFFLEGKYVYNNQLHIGECAGLQDFFLGFGMRYAITSGFLAAQSIIEDKDFENLIKERFKSQLEASIVNRFLFEMLGNRGYQFLIGIIRFNKNPIRFFYKLYNISLSKKLLLPFAKFWMRSKKDKHKNCNCSWCRSRIQEKM